MTERQQEIALHVSRAAAGLTENWICELIRNLSALNGYDRVAALMLLRDLAAGKLPPLPISTTARLAKVAEPVLETMVDCDLYTLSFRSLASLKEMSKFQSSHSIVSVWDEQFIPSRN